MKPKYHFVHFFFSGLGNILPEFHLVAFSEAVHIDSVLLLFSSSVVIVTPSILWLDILTILQCYVSKGSTGVF